MLQNHFIVWRLKFNVIFTWLFLKPWLKEVFDTICYVMAQCFLLKRHFISIGFVTNLNIYKFYVLDRCKRQVQKIHNNTTCPFLCEAIRKLPCVQKDIPQVALNLELDRIKNIALCANDDVYSQKYNIHQHFQVETTALTRSLH